MFVAKVTGSVVATQKLASMTQYPSLKILSLGAICELPREPGNSHRLLLQNASYNKTFVDVEGLVSSEV